MDDIPHEISTGDRHGESNACVYVCHLASQQYACVECFLEQEDQHQVVVGQTLPAACLRKALPLVLHPRGLPFGRTQMTTAF